MHKVNKNIIEDLLHDRPRAMEQLFKIYYKPLCCYATRYIASMPVAEEIVSDVLYKIWLNRNSGYSVETFRNYLFTATRNTAINYLKQQANIKKLSDNWAEQLRHELIEETPLDTIIVNELQLKFESLMKTLPEQTRKAFKMSRFGDMTYEEIAAQMHISINTVKYHIKIALQKLRAGMDNFLAWIIFLWTVIF